MRRLASLLAIPLLALTTAAAAAQGAPAAAAASVDTAAERAAVMAVITKMFDGMRTRDTAAMRAAFDTNVALVSVGRTREGTPMARREPMDGFIKGVAAAPAGKVLDERLFNPVVHIDGALANVWVEYDFVFDGKFSHCGVDAFMLAKLADGWKIVSLADTRRREGCPTR
jgi:hypothetical protein